jgi:hypothetical protein
MDNFIDAFRRNADGSWSCIARGKLFMGVDVARFLEAQALREAADGELNH